MKAAKAAFAIMTTVEDDMLEHIRHTNSSKEVWDTFKVLFSRKNHMRLQLLENELLSIRQPDMSINQYFTKLKYLAREISTLNSTTVIPESRIKSIIIHRLRPEYSSFITPIQAWSTQPSLTDLENLLTDQEAMCKQTSMASLKSDEEALFSSNRRGQPRQNDNKRNDDKDGHHRSS